MTTQPSLIVATGNAHKTAEIADALRYAGVKLQVFSAKAVGGMPKVEETGSSFAANARLKAKALRAKVSRTDWVLADDSGLAVDALHGAPGIYSARYAGDHATDAENNQKLITALKGLPEKLRTARFICCLVLLGDGVDETFQGECPGHLLTAPRGDAGFGYDPLFVPDGHEQTFAELGSATKERLSHRARACKMLSEFLLKRL